MTFTVVVPVVHLPFATVLAEPYDDLPPTFRHNHDHSTSRPTQLSSVGGAPFQMPVPAAAKSWRFSFRTHLGLGSGSTQSSRSTECMDGARCLAGGPATLGAPASRRQCHDFDTPASPRSPATGISQYFPTWWLGILLLRLSSWGHAASLLGAPLCQIACSSRSTRGLLISGSKVRVLDGPPSKSATSGAPEWPIWSPDPILATNWLPTVPA